MVEQYLGRNTSEDRYRRVRNGLDSIVSGKVNSSKADRVQHAQERFVGGPRSAFQWLPGAQPGPDQGRGSNLSGSCIAGR